jgi:hypothetical protein
MGSMLKGLLPSFTYHQGGVVGDTSVPMRNVNPGIFANAPRLHSGLAGDEFPAILQKGETVIQKGGGAGVTVNIIDKTGADISTQSRQTQQGMEIDVMIDQAVAKKLGTFGSSSNKTLKQNFGAKERLTNR